MIIYIYIYIYKDGQNQDHMKAAMDSVEHVSYSHVINECIYIYDYIYIYI